MFGKKPQPPIKSLIAQGSRIEGNLIFTDGLRIDGSLLLRSARINGTVNIKDARIDNNIEGINRYLHVLPIKFAKRKSSRR